MTIYELLQSRESGSSGTGASYYGSFSQCGMKGRLQELFPYDERDRDLESNPPYGSARVDGRRAGTIFHLLQECWRTGTLPEDVAVGPEGDASFDAAAASFRAYRLFAKNDIHNLGRVHSAERKLPENSEQQKRIKAFIGGFPFTMRYDLLVDITLEDIARLAIERGISIPEEGLYIIDYKLVRAITDSTMWDYSYSFQQLAYPVIYNICFPDAPVKGMLTEVMARVQKPESRHFALYLAYPDENVKRIVRDGVRRAAQLRRTGWANPFACIGKYSPCFFLKNSACPRYGKFRDFDFSSGRGVPRAQS